MEKEQKNDSILFKLNETQQFHISLVANLLREFEKEKIITPTQRSQCSSYMLSKMK